ncbi:MAG: DUF2884 family protein [Cellvibrio sp.]
MKLLLLPLGFIFASSAFAGGSCDLELQSSLRISSSSLEFIKDGAEQYRIVNDQDLWVANKKIALNQQQRLVVKDYALGVRAMVPEVRELTLDGVDLAADAMKLVFDEFLGADHQAPQEVNGAFRLLRKDVEKSFSTDQPIYLNQKGSDATNILGKEFRARVNEIMESSGEEIAWSFIKAIGASIFSSNREQDFETSMKKFGARMEREMKQHSEKLEVSGNKVCHLAKQLDLKEEELKKSVNNIALFNFILIREKSEEGKRHDGL